MAIKPPSSMHKSKENQAHWFLKDNDYYLLKLHEILYQITQLDI